MNTPNFARLNGGFSMLESMIAMGLLSMVAIVIVSSNWQIFHMQRMADRRADNDQMRAAVMSALADSSRCAVNLRDSTTNSAPVQLNSGHDIDVWDVDSSGTPYAVLRSNVASTFSTNVSQGLSNGPTYELKQEDLTGVASVALAASPTTGRNVATNRYIATLVLSSTVNGFSSRSTSRIPISMEFDQGTGNLVSCTTNPEDVDEVLYANAHTVRDCINNQGSPYPTKMGLLCRQPMTFVRADNTAASCGGWNSTAYNSSTSRDYMYQDCSGTQTTVTGWHYFSIAAPIESATVDVKKGTENSYNWQTVSGVSGALTVGYLFGIIALTNPLTALAFALGALFSWFLSISGCTNVHHTFYSQAMAIGCY